MILFTPYFCAVCLEAHSVPHRGVTAGTHSVPDWGMSLGIFRSEWVNLLDR